MKVYRLKVDIKLWMRPDQIHAVLLSHAALVLSQNEPVLSLTENKYIYGKLSLKFHYGLKCYEELGVKTERQIL